jgi:hypothetical protein
MRAQIAVEFSFMMMLSFVFLVVGLVIVAFYLEATSKDRVQMLLQDEAVALQQELLLAASVQDGYQRTVAVPDTLDGYPYAIANTGNLVTLTLPDGTNYNKEIPIVTGTLVKGPNRVRKLAGAIIIDQP